MDNKSIINWIQLIAFSLVIIGGLNWLLIGLFNFDLFELIFGGREGIAGRVIYSLFGLGAAILLTTVIIRAVSTKKANKKSKSSK